MLIVFLVARQSFKKYLYGTFTFSRTELKRDFLVENSAKLNSQVLQPPHSHPESMTFVSNNRPQLVKCHKSYFQVSKKYFINLTQKLQPWEKKTSMKTLKSNFLKPDSISVVSVDLNFVATVTEWPLCWALTGGEIDVYEWDLN